MVKTEVLVICVMEIVSGGDAWVWDVKVSFSNLQ